MSSDQVAPDPEPAVPPPRPQPPRFDAEPYRPDGATPLGGLALLMGGVFPAAMALGLALSFAWLWFYLPFIFAIIAGALLGAAAQGLVRRGRVRSPAVAGTVAALGAVGMMFSMHYFNCLHDLGWQVPPAATVFEYIDLEAQAGVEFGEVGANNGGVNLGYAGSYIYFAAETALAAGFAFAIARLGAVAPFCRECGAWKKPRTLGGLPFVRPQAAVDAVKAGAMLELLETAAPLGGGYSLFLKIFHCPRCGGESTVVAAVELITTDSRGRRFEKLLCQHIYPGEVLALLDAHTPWLSPPAVQGTGTADVAPEVTREDVRPAE